MMSRDNLKVVFDIDDVRVLKKTQSTRESLLDGYIATGVENLGAEDLDVVTKLLDSMDKQIHTNTKIALAKKDTDTRQDYTQLVKTILTKPVEDRTGKPTIPDNLYAVNVLPDELSFDREEFRVEDYLRSEDDI